MPASINASIRPLAQLLQKFIFLLKGASLTSIRMAQNLRFVGFGLICIVCLFHGSLEVHHRVELTLQFNGLFAEDGDLLHGGSEGAHPLKTVISLG